MPATRTLPNIQVDQSKCISPMKCGKCLRACPAVVLLCIPQYNQKFRECAYEDFTVIVHNRPACTVCLKCVEACPVGCIQVEYHEEI